MDNDKTYNGWSSYETWAVKLWIDNDQGTHEYWQERARTWAESYDMPEDWPVSRERWAQYRFAEELKEGYHYSAPDLGASVWADLLGSALSEVNWNEIAKSLLEDAKELATP